MAYFSTEPAPERRNVTGKNRVWDFFQLSSKTHPANRRQPAQPRRKILPTATKSASGIPYWPSRDPIEEEGGLNLYAFAGNDGVNFWDYLGLNLKTGQKINVKCGGLFSKSAGTISVDEYSISDGQFTLLSGPKKGTQVVGFGAKLKLTFSESDPKCCCQNGKYRWYQTITKDNDPTYEKEPVPRPDTGPPSLAPLYGKAFEMQRFFGPFCLRVVSFK